LFHGKRLWLEYFNQSANVIKFALLHCYIVILDRTQITLINQMITDKNIRVDQSNTTHW